MTRPGHVHEAHSFDRLSSDLSVLTNTLRECEDGSRSCAFVAVGDRFAPTLRYLSRFRGPDCAYGLVVADRTAVLIVPERAEAAAEAAFRRTNDGFDRRVVAEPLGTARGDAKPIGVRVAGVVSDLTDTSEGSVLVPPSIPHSTVAFLERDGYDVSSTSVVAEARTIKTDAEIERLRRVQRAAAHGMARAETLLASGTDADGPLVRDGDGAPVSTEQLRRRINATLALEGVSDAGNTAVQVGSFDPEHANVFQDRRETDIVEITSGEPVCIRIAPCGPDGYHGVLTRTFVVDGEGGWERRAAVAVEAARSAAIAQTEPGVAASAVYAESIAELGAYGFPPAATESTSDTGETAHGSSAVAHESGGGVGLRRREPPSLSSNTELEAGHVLSIEPGVSDPSAGTVRIGDLVVVTDEGAERLGEYPTSIVPRRRDID